MGKTKKNKTKAKTNNPTGLPSVRDISIEEEHLGDDEFECRSLQAVVEQIQSPNVEDKLCGLQTLATLFYQPSTIAEALKSGVVRIVGPLLVDSSSDIRNASAGALRNLSLSGADACDILIDQDVLTPLFALLKQYSGEWLPQVPAVGEESSEIKLNEKADTFLQAVHLVWNLCESSSRALDLLNQSQLVPILARGLDVEHYGYDIAIGVAQCLQVVTEDNPTVIDLLIPSEGLLNNLLQLEGDEFRILLLRTLTAGIIINVSSSKSHRLSQIFSTLHKTLTCDHRSGLSALSSALPLGDEAEKSNFNPDLENQIKQMEYLLEAQKTAVELLTNICSGEDIEELSTMDCDASDNENDSDYEDIDSDSSGIILPLDKIPVEVLEAVGSLNIVEKVWTCAQPLPENVDNILQEHEPGRSLLKKAATLRSSALLCLHNLSSSLPLEMLGGAKALRSVWLQVGHQVFRGKRGDECLLESATALMRAALERLRQGPPGLFAEISENDIQLMLEGEQHCVDSEVRANWLRMLGLLGPLLSEPLALRIASFLLEVCAKETQLWPLAEALDALVDMFSEDDTDVLAINVELIEKLTPLVPVLKNKMRQHKRSLGERALAVATVSSNLTRFIKYKKSRLIIVNEKI